MTMNRFIMPVFCVQDIKRSVNFYKDLFSVEIKHDFGENVVFEQGFALWQQSRASQIIFQDEHQLFQEDGRKYTELYFESEDIELIWLRIQSADVDVIHGLKEESWGQRTFRIFDPDRFIVEVAEPMERVIRRFSDTMNMSVEEISNRTQFPKSKVEKILSRV